jgi:hypothetical protein
MGAACGPSLQLGEREAPQKGQLALAGAVQVKVVGEHRDAVARQSDIKLDHIGVGVHGFP